MKNERAEKFSDRETGDFSVLLDDSCSFCYFRNASENINGRIRFMKYILLMILAFIVLVGIVLFLKSMLHIDMGEGIFLSVAMIAALFSLSSMTGTFLYGFYVLLVVSCLGIALYIIRDIRGQMIGLKMICSPVVITLFLLYFCWLIFLRNDFIQHIDELHHWAAGVKYMVTKDAMPTGGDFVAGPGNYAWATTLFHLFFQKFTGYNEQSMYVSASLLMWIGFLLPFSSYQWKDWKKIAMYVGIMYIGLYTLYSYGPKSLYVDVPTAAWAGGLAAWWTRRKKKKSDYLIAGSGLVMLHFFKASAGLLMAVFVLLFMVLYTFAIENGYLYKKNNIKLFRLGTGLLSGLVLLGSVTALGIVYSIQPYETVKEETAADQQVDDMERWAIAGKQLPDSISSQINVVKLSRTKVQKTFGAFMTVVFGTPLASRSNWDIPFLPCILGILILFKAYGDIYEEKKKSQLYLMYSVFMVLTYAAAVYFSYILMFAYELSIEMRSASRYFSICCIFLIIMLLSELLQPKPAKKEKVREYTLLGILLFFALGLNTSFVPNATAVNKEKISGYDKIHDTVLQVNKIQGIISDTDKVYYLCQQPEDNLGGAELYNCSALYYLEEQVSNYLAMPWKFTNTGCNIRLEEFDTSIADFPTLLAQGGYTYVWIHTTNSYLTRELPMILPCDKEISDGYLYRVVYENGAPISLEFVQDLDD